MSKLIDCMYTLRHGTPHGRDKAEKQIIELFEAQKARHVEDTAGLRVELTLLKKGIKEVYGWSKEVNNVPFVIRNMLKNICDRKEIGQ